jgi:hypothetical protein
MMLTPQIRRERGQAIVLLALALIGLLGFAAVALDGGNIYSEQRRAQSAADNAVLAAAYQYMTVVATTSMLSTTALANAAVNDYDNNTTSNWVSFYRPPTSGAYVGNSAYMQVVITEVVPTALAHLVYKGPFQLTVSAVGYAKYGGPPVDGNAIVAMDPHGCGIINTTGTSGGSVGMATSGGGIFANSDGRDCTGGNDVIDTSGSGSTITSAPPFGISVVATTTHAYGDGISPTPTTGVAPLPGDPLADLAPPDCAAGPGGSPSDGTINPGTYNALNATGDLVLNPGLYCIVGVGNNTVNLGPHGTLRGTGVVLYVPYGQVDLEGGTVVLTAPTTTTNPECVTTPALKDQTTSVCHYLGMVFFIGRTNILGLKLSGNSAWDVEGTIYNPNSDITLGGGADWSLKGQVLAKTVISTGGGVITVVFDPNEVYKPDPAVSLVQ